MKVNPISWLALGLLPGLQLLFGSVPAFSQSTLPRGPDAMQSHAGGALIMPGAEFGVKNGDVIKEINGHAVSDPMDAQAQLIRDRHSITRVKVLRAGKLIILKKKRT